MPNKIHASPPPAAVLAVALLRLPNTDAKPPASACFFAANCFLAVTWLSLQSHLPTARDITAATALASKVCSTLGCRIVPCAH
jgi:hypothetical protein